MKRPVKILLILLGAAVLTVLVVVANVSRSRSQVRGIEVAIRYGDTPVLVSEQTVVDTVLGAMPALLQQSIKSVDCDRVADAARNVPFLTRVSAAVSVSGKVVVRADQRRPIARLYYGSRELYMDGEGGLFPTSSSGNCNVLVAGGDFKEPLRMDSLNAQTRALWEVALYLDDHRDYKNFIDQIYVLSRWAAMSSNWAMRTTSTRSSPTWWRSTARGCRGPGGTPIPR